MAQDIGKALQELSKAIENNEAVEYKVPKDICANEEELRAYVEAEELF